MFGWIAKLWHSGSATPWADVKLDSANHVRTVAYNRAYVDRERLKLGLIADGKTDEEIVALLDARTNADREDPQLEVLHLGIEADGRVKVKLEWNDAFIRHLTANGFSGDNEDEIIEAYLALVSGQAARNMMTEEENIIRQLQNPAIVDKMFSGDEFREDEDRPLIPDQPKPRRRRRSKNNPS